MNDFRYWLLTGIAVGILLMTAFVIAANSAESALPSNNHVERYTGQP